MRRRAVRIVQNLKRGGAARAARPEFGPAPQLMDSLPEQHIEDLPAATREDAYAKVGKVFLLRREGTASEDELARKAATNTQDREFLDRLTLLLISHPEEGWEKEFKAITRREIERLTNPAGEEERDE